ncbi:MAG: hypothetical protein M0Z49_05860 [Chloroflexi bacterium]|nr:hypothetical protein [Chloroflexota bacterium]MDA8237963.1 hypothetical protein [Chloroflexota bacterium]
MAKRRRTRQERRPAPARRTMPRWLLPAVTAVVVVGVGAVLVVNSLPRDGQTAWARFDTADVHSLVFVGGDPNHVLFGHHGGLLESSDGGRSWSSLPVRDDAMSMAPADDGSIVIAGHEVFTASRDGGATWSSIPADLPSLDIHGFTRDPADPARMWAYLAIGGLWESTDFGTHWTEVRADNVAYPLAVRDGSTTRLLGVDATGLVMSADGGRTWTTLGAPPAYPMTGLAATPDGRTVYAGAPDGLFRSDDGGRTWSPTGYRGSAFAVATTPEGATVAVVSQETEFFRSADQGSSWPGP